MNNKRTLVISAIAVLVVILSGSAFLVYNRSVDRAHPIPVTGISNSGESQRNQIIQQNQADNSSVDSQWPLVQEDMPSRQALQARQAQAAKSVSSKWVPGEEYIQGPQSQSVNSGVPGN